MRPNLLNAILVEIQQPDITKTVYHGRRREPINVVTKQPAFKMKAQIVFNQDKYLDAALSQNPDNRNLAGVIEKAIGYIVVRVADLRSLGKELATGDKIISYGNAGKEKECSFYLIGMKGAAHYSDNGECGLERWYFEDRN